MNITWKIVAGTKVESIKDDETVELLSRSGCKNIFQFRLKVAQNI